MARFLSPEWIDHLDASVRDGAGFDRPPDGLSMVVEQHVTHPDGHVTQFQVVFADGTVRVRPGAEATADVRFLQDLATAVAIAQGTESAQRAFMTGHLRVGGDLRVLSDNGEVLARLNDAFAEIRRDTTYVDADTTSPGVVPVEGYPVDEAGADPPPPGVASPPQP